MKRTAFYVFTTLFMLLFAAIFMLLLIGLPALAFNESDGSAEIIAKFETAYTVIIPPDATIPFEAEKTEIGELAVKNMLILPDYEVSISISHGALKSGEKSIAYELTSAGKPFSGASFTDDGSYTLSAEISADAWKAADSGVYSDIVTFTVAYRRQQN